LAHPALRRRLCSARSQGMNVLPNLPPCFGCPREGADIPEGHRDLEPGQIANGL
jgi:hypothetical protein